MRHIDWSPKSRKYLYIKDGFIYDDTSLFKSKRDIFQAIEFFHKQRNRKHGWYQYID